MLGLSNCFIFTLSLYLRRRRNGRAGYIAIRRSRWGPFPHVLYVRAKPNGSPYGFVSYVPTQPRCRLLPPPLFRGAVRWGDSA